VSCDYTSTILVIGQSNGVFSVYNIDTIEAIHSFQIAQNKIDSVCVNATGDCIAMAAET